MHRDLPRAWRYTLSDALYWLSRKVKPHECIVTVGDTTYMAGCNGYTYVSGPSRVYYLTVDGEIAKP